MQINQKKASQKIRTTVEKSTLHEKFMDHIENHRILTKQKIEFMSRETVEKCSLKGLYDQFKFR